MKKVVSLIVALAMVAALTPSVMAEEPDGSLIASASFDSEIAAETGTITAAGSGITVGDGIRENAAVLPGGAENYLKVASAQGADDLLVGKDALTIAFFEKRESGTWPLFIAPDTKAQVHLSSENYIGVFDNGSELKVERYVGRRDNSDSSVTSGGSGDKYPKGEWKHIAVVLTDEYTELFVNGKSAARVESGSALSKLFSSASYIQIGRGNWGANGEDFKGSIDEFKIFDRVLDSDEILSLSKYATPIEKVAAAIAIADPDNVTGDLKLITDYKGATIKWTSSNPAVITNEGKVTRPLEDTQVTLTAEITNDLNETDSVDFVVTVRSQLQAILDEIEIHDANNILDSVTLVKKSHGVDINWTSSNPQVVTDKDEPNPESPEYTIPAGYVTRGKEDVKVTLTAQFDYNGAPHTETYDLTVKAVKPEEDKVAYLYAYFRGNVNGENEHLSIHLATSLDGYNWTDLNGNFPVIESDMGTKALRDPYILRSRYGDKFYLVATDLDTQDGGNWAKWSLEGSKYLMVWASEDLVHWGDQRMVKFADDNIGCAWAPESVYDVDTGEYLVYASGKDLQLKAQTGKELDTVYVARTRDFYSFSEPKMFFEPLKDGNRVPAIDSTIIRADDGKYYHFYKKESGYIMMMVSDHAAGPYKEVSTFATIPGEGPAIYKVNGTNKYALCVDNYSKYVPYLTDDISSGIFTKSEGEVTMPTGSKHGGMIPISQSEYNALLAAYGPKDVDGDGAEAIYTQDFEGQVQGLQGGASITEDADKGGKVLTLDGVDGYFQFPEKLFDRRDTYTLLMDVNSDMADDDAFFTFALGQGDNTDHYLFFRARKSQLRVAETVYGWKHERDAAVTGNGIAGNWARIALVVKPGYLAIYKDGVLVAENTDAHVGEGDLLGGKFTTSHLGVDGLVAYLGKSFFPSDKYMKGSFDDIALYNRALSPEEILSDATGSLSDENIINADIKKVNIPAVIRNDITLPTAGVYGSSIVWTSGNADVLTAEGKVTRPSFKDGDIQVVLTAVYTKGTKTKTVLYPVTVKAADNVWLSTDDWSTYNFGPVSGDAYISFDITPYSFDESLIGIAPSNVTPGKWGDYAIGVRTNASGAFQANMGDSNYTGSVPYEVGKTYHATIVTNTAKQTYSFYITDDRGETSTVAENMPYRVKTGSDLAKVNVRSGYNVAAGRYAVENFRADGSGVQAVFSQAADGRVSYVVRNFTSSEANLDMFAAFFNGDKLISAKRLAGAMNAGEQRLLETDIPEGCTVIKFLTWESDSLIPKIEVLATTLAK